MIICEFHSVSLSTIKLPVPDCRTGSRSVASREVSGCPDILSTGQTVRLGTRATLLRSVALSNQTDSEEKDHDI